MVTARPVTSRTRSKSVVTVSQLGWESRAPLPLTPLIGRREELANACALLRRRSVRLLTLTGLGGIGKTRLAQELATELEEDFADGIVWISLAAIRDPEAVVPAIAATFGISGVAVADRLHRALRDSQLLLILDNFEQVIDAAPRVAELLMACPALQVLVTSRSRLRIRGERVLPVPPLSLRHETPGGGKVGGESLHHPPLTLQSEATTLFVERAQALESDLDVSGANASVVAEICQRLDGLPLAIELAAARVSHLALPALLARLERRLPLLVDGDRDLPARLQTMHNAIAWSYDLLTPAEQLLFRCLGAFDGGFRLDAVDEVFREFCAALATQDRLASVPATGQGDVLDLVASLIEKSLLNHEPDASETPRYAMLETVREFAGERLVAAGELEIARQAHGAYFLRRAEQEELAHVLLDGERRLDALEAERANMRVALAWWVDSGQPERLLAHAAALGGFWYARIQLKEGVEWLERALAGSDAATSPARARALTWLALISFLRGDMPGTESRGADALRMCQSRSDLACWASGACDGALLRPFTASYALYALGVARFHLGDPADASARFDEGRAISETIPDARIASVMAGRQIRSLGIVAGEQGNLDEAGNYYATALHLFQTFADTPGIRRSLGDLAYLAMQRGEYAEALTRFKEVLAQDRVGASTLALHDDLMGAAVSAMHQERSERAVHCLAATEALGERLGIDTFVPSERVAWDGAVAVAKRALGSVAFTRAWDAGKKMGPELAIAALLEIPTSQVTVEARPTLSERELEVLQLLVAGRTDREIGEALFISHRTVEFHVSRILSKLGVGKRSGAVAAALAAGMVDPPSATMQRAEAV